MSDAASDVLDLREQLAAERSRNAELELRLQEREQDVARLELKVDALLRRIFGRRSEKLPSGQLGLFGEAPTKEEIENTPDDEATHETPPEKRFRRRRKPNLKDLPRQRVVHEIPEAERVCDCCGAVKQPFGEDVSEMLDFEPARFFVIEHVRPKYACRTCQEGVVQAHLPPRPIEQGRPGPGLLAQVLVSKFLDHLPLARQSRIFARYGLEIARSTLCDWVAACADLLSAIVKEMKRELLLSKVVQADETRLLVLEDHNERRRRECWLFVYRSLAGDVVFDFRPTRARAGPEEFLEDFTGGYLQRDGYQGYNGISPEITAVGCWAHARRKWEESLPSQPEPAREALDLIGRLYGIEKKAKALPSEDRAALRQAEAAPILGTIAERLDAWEDQALPKGPLGKAAHYTRSQWSTLVRYVEDGDLAIDNNAIERAIRGVAVGRHNWLFSGSYAGAERTAVVYSIIESCKAAGINPFDYLKDVLVAVATTPQSRISKLTPRGWKAVHPAPKADTPAT